MTILADEELRRAEGLWRSGRAVDAGRMILEAVPSNDRPAWAAGVLRWALTKSNIPPIWQFYVILDIAETPECWRRAHQAFSNVRALTLILDKKNKQGQLTHEEQLIHTISSIAELVAKVSYNASNPADEFDEDSGWWIADVLKGVSDSLDEEGMTSEIWKILVTKPQVHYKSERKSMWKYYPIVDSQHVITQNVVRFFGAGSFLEIGRKAPEYYNPDLGWRPAGSLYSDKCSGEINEGDEIPEVVADIIIQKLMEGYDCRTAEGG